MDQKIDHEQRASRLWPVLTAAARERQELTYGAAAKAIGIHYRAMAYALDPIQRHCLIEGLPRLTGIVYAATTGLPGGGYAGEPGNKADLEDVWGFDWASVRNPFSMLHNAELEELAGRLSRSPANTALEYVLQLSRGDQQRVFRRAVLKAYNYACAICGITFCEVLEAAHIIPFGDPRASLRIHPRNGICLCSNHHRLFDSGYIAIAEDYKIRFSDPYQQVGDYTAEDIHMTVHYHRKKLLLPDDKRLWPDLALLNERNS